MSIMGVETLMWSFLGAESYVTCMMSIE